MAVHKLVRMGSHGASVDPDGGAQLVRTGTWRLCVLCKIKNKNDCSTHGFLRGPPP
jgi:hypothetical protein